MSDTSHAVSVSAVSGAAGAEEGACRGDVVVVIDALRASVTVAAGLRAGAARVVPVLTVEEAEAHLDDPGFRVAGERRGARLPGFHYGNSPLEILAHRDEIAGRTLVLTTSNGTRCVAAALPGAAAVLAGGAVNARAVAGAALALAKAHQAGVTVVAAGLFDEPAPEDDFCQQLILHRLCASPSCTGSPCGCLSLAEVREEDSLSIFVNARAGTHLIHLGYAEDVRLCAQVDIWDTVPVYRGDGFYPWPGETGDARGG